MSFQLQIGQKKNALISVNDLEEPQIRETSVTMPLQIFSSFIVMQFDSKSSWLEEKSVYGSIILTTVSFFIAGLLEPAAFCKKIYLMMPSPTTSGSDIISTR